MYMHIYVDLPTWKHTNMLRVAILKKISCTILPIESSIITHLYACDIQSCIPSLIPLMVSNQSGSLIGVIYIYIHTYIYKYIYVFMYIYIIMYIYIYIYMHMYISICVYNYYLVWFRWWSPASQGHSRGSQTWKEHASHLLWKYIKNTLISLYWYVYMNMYVYIVYILIYICIYIHTYIYIWPVRIIYGGHEFERDTQITFMNIFDE
jgi:hypothetical protein